MTVMWHQWQPRVLAVAFSWLLVVCVKPVVVHHVVLYLVVEVVAVCGQRQLVVAVGPENVIAQACDPPWYTRTVYAHPT